MSEAAGHQATASAGGLREHSARPGRRRPGRRAIALSATLLLAALFTYLAVRGVDWHKAWLALKHCNAWWLVPAMAAFAAQILMRAMRWRSLFAPTRRPARGPIVAATLIGYLFNNIMPARAGEAARVVALTQRTETPAAEIVGTALVERAYDVLSILIVFFCRLAVAAARELVPGGRDPRRRRGGGPRVRDLDPRRARRPAAAVARAPARRASPASPRSASSARPRSSTRVSPGFASAASRSRRCYGASRRGSRPPSGHGASCSPSSPRAASARACS